MFAIITVRKALHVVDLNGVDGMADIRCEGDTLTLGAMCRQRTVERSAEVSAAVPLVVEALGNVGHPAIRNRGTVGGSIAHADPAAEMPAVALCLDAEMVAQGPAGGRVIPATEFFDGFLTTALAEEEVLTGIRFPVDGPGSGSAFAEVARRHGDFAMAGVAVHVRLDGDTVVEARIAVSGVGLTPVRATEAESSLRGATAAEDAFAAAAALVDAETRDRSAPARPVSSWPRSPRRSSAGAFLSPRAALKCSHSLGITLQLVPLHPGRHDSSTNLFRSQRKGGRGLPQRQVKHLTGREPGRVPQQSAGPSRGRRSTVLLTETGLSAV